MRTFALLCVLLSIVALSEGKTALVLLDQLSQQSKYSQYFESLKDFGFKLTIKQTDDTSLKLVEYGEALYDSLIILSPHAEEFGGSLSVPAILAYIDQGNSVIVAADSKVSDVIRELASECGVDFHPEVSEVKDHFNPVNSLGAFSLTAKNLVDSPVVVGSQPLSERNPIHFKGIGSTISGSPELNFAILSGSETTFSTSKVEQFGSDIVLISALQARNGARVLVSGSLDFFTNAFFKQSSNKQLALDLTNWTFKQSGIVRVASISHHLTDGTEPDSYTIKDTVLFSTVIEELVDGQWVAFKSSKVQLQFSMIDPYVRGTLSSGKKGKFEMSFILPDVYGVFTFHLRFRDLGYNSIDEYIVKPVRPLRHDEYPRFLRTASPYYASCISMVVGVVLFSIFGLYSK